MSEFRNPPPEPSAHIVREWAACGIVAAVSRFVPVPLLDDVVKERATRLAVARTLKAHHRDYDVTDVEVLYTGVDGWFAGAKKYLVGIPARIVLFPVRKYVAVFGAVKGVPSDVMGVILLSRTVHRCLARGGLATADDKALRREASQLRKAYESAFDEMDLRLLTGALGDALSTGRGLSAAAAEFAQRLVDRLPGRRSDEAEVQDDVDNGTRDAKAKNKGHNIGDGDGRGPDDDRLDDELTPELEQGADEVEQVLRRPEIATLMEEFDRRVDAYLGIAA